MIDYSLHVFTGCFVKNIGGEFGDLETFLDHSPSSLHQHLSVSDVEKPAVVEGEHGLPLLDFLRKDVSTMKNLLNMNT